MLSGCALQSPEGLRGRPSEQGSGSHPSFYQNSSAFNICIPELHIILSLQKRSAITKTKPRRWGWMTWVLFLAQSLVNNHRLFFWFSVCPSIKWRWKTLTSLGQRKLNLQLICWRHENNRHARELIHSTKIGWASFIWEPLCQVGGVQRSTGRGRPCPYAFIFSERQSFSEYHIARLTLRTRVPSGRWPEWCWEAKKNPGNV